MSSAFASLGLDTKPDFRAVHLDASVVLTEREEVVRAELDDPTTRVSRLSTADFRSSPGDLVSVRSEDSVERAVTLMLLHDFSQLPVLAGPRQAKGVVSWKSLATRVSQGLAVGDTTSVREVMDTAFSTVRLDDSILEAVEFIVRDDFVLVSDATKGGEITGIVTTADLSELFRDLATPFLLLGEIENHLRGLLDGLFKPSELAAAQKKDPGERTEQSPTPELRLTDLTFGAYQQLVGKPSYWSRLGLSLDRKEFLAHLDRVRETRNAVMHFDPDRLDEGSIEQLHQFSGLLRRLREVRPNR